MRKYLTILLLVFSSYSCNQPEKRAGEAHIAVSHASIDTLLFQLTRAGEDTSKVKLLNALSTAYARDKFDKAIVYGKSGLDLAKQLGWESGIAQSYQNIGIGHAAKSDFPIALNSFQAALRIYEAIADSIGIATVYTQLGEVYYSQTNFTEALSYYFKALKHFENRSDKHGTAMVLGKIGMVYFHLAEPKTLEYLNKALAMNTALGNKNGIAENLRFIGNVYEQRLKDHHNALPYYFKALKIEEELGNKSRIAINLVNIGIVYGSLNDHYKELDYKFRGLKLCEEIGEKAGIANALGNLGWSYFFIGTDSNETLDPMLSEFDVYDKKNALVKARDYMLQCGKLMEEVGELDFESYYVISKIDSIFGNYKGAYENYKKSVDIKDFVHGRDQTKSVAHMQLQYDFEKRELEAKAAQEKKEIVQRNIRNTTISGLIVALIVLVVVYRQRNQTRIEKKRSDSLLRNILPDEVAEELKAKGSAEARHFDQVTVMFTDFKNFTMLSEQMTATELVAEIDCCFKVFDEIIEKYDIEKIKTIGDSYMCAGGLPVTNLTHAFDVVNAALEMQAFIGNRIAEKARSGQEAFQIRIGIHTGPVVAGIVGFKKFAYDIWGDTVNTASRMESSGEAGKINISGTTYALIQDKFICTHRGKIMAKNKGELDMYFVEGKKEKLQV